MADLRYLETMGLGDCSHMTVEQRKLEMLDARYYATAGSSWSVKNLKFRYPRLKHSRAKKGLEPDEPVLIRVGGCLYETVKTRYWKNFEYELVRGQIEFYDLMKNTTLHLSPKEFQDPNAAYTKELYKKHFDNYNISSKFIEDMAAVLKHVNAGKTVKRLRDYVVSWKKQLINKQCLVVKVMKGPLHSYQAHLPPADSFMFESFTELLTKDDLAEIRANYRNRIRLVQERSLSDAKLARQVILSEWDVNSVYITRYAARRDAVLKERAEEQARKEEEERKAKPAEEEVKPTREQLRKQEKKRKEREKKKLQAERKEQERQQAEAEDLEAKLRLDCAVSAVTLIFIRIMEERRRASLENLLSCYARAWKSEKELQRQRFMQGVRKCKQTIRKAVFQKVARRFLRKIKWENLVDKNKERYLKVLTTYVSEKRRANAKIDFWKKVLDQANRPAASLFSFKPRYVEYKPPPQSWYGFKLNNTLYIAMDILGIPRTVLEKKARDDFVTVKTAVRELSIFFRSKNFIKFCNDHSTTTKESFNQNRMANWVAKFLVGEEVTTTTLIKSALAFGVTIPGRRFSTYILNHAEEIVSTSKIV